jgi:ubiquinone/menaquinone biosynthesis C-methylase UbiE
LFGVCRLSRHQKRRREMTALQDPWENKERARKYASHRSMVARLVYAPFARRVMACLDPSIESPTIVDLGAGPGLLAVELGRLRPRARIVGVDPSGEMLQIARENAAKAGLSNHDARQGRAEEIPLESGCVDLVVSESSLHEWEDPHRGLAEIYRVLRPGGCLILRDYNLAWLSDWKRKLLGLLHSLDMFKFGFDEVASMARQTGFEQIQGRGKGVQYFLLATKRRG